MDARTVIVQLPDRSSSDRTTTVKVYAEFNDIEPLDTVRIDVLVDKIFKLHAEPNSFRGNCFKQDHWKKQY